MSEGDGHGDKPSRDLSGFIDTAARLGDSHGDEASAIRILTSGLAKFPDAPAIDRCRALLYRAELAARAGDSTLARTSLTEAGEIEFDPDQRELLADEFDHTAQLVEELERRS